MPEEGIRTGLRTHVAGYLQPAERGSVDRAYGSALNL